MSSLFDQKSSLHFRKDATERCPFSFRTFLRTGHRQRVNLLERRWIYPAGICSVTKDTDTELRRVLPRHMYLSRNSGELSLLSSAASCRENSTKESLSLLCAGENQTSVPAQRPVAAMARLATPSTLPAFDLHSLTACLLNTFIFFTLISFSFPSIHAGDICLYGERTGLRHSAVRTRHSRLSRVDYYSTDERCVLVTSVRIRPEAQKRRR